MILCCGEALIDLLPRKGTLDQQVFQPFSGGSVFNTAVALARLGVKTGLLAGISKDFFGDQLIGALKANGVSTTYCRRKDRHSTLAFVQFEDTQPRYCFIDEASASRDLRVADLPGAIPRVQALHFGSISLIPEPCGSTYERLLTRECKNKFISLDPNIRPSLIENKQKHLSRLNRLIPRCDLVKASDEDVHWMMGGKRADVAARRWLKSGAKIVAITQGDQGVSVFAEAFDFHVPAPKVLVADTVGAGDTLTAGLLARLHAAGRLHKDGPAEVSEAELQQAVRFAVQAAAVTVSRPGADPPWRQEIPEI
jgi:fructokinase